MCWPSHKGLGEVQVYRESTLKQNLKLGLTGAFSRMDLTDKPSDLEHSDLRVSASLPGYRNLTSGQRREP